MARRRKKNAYAKKARQKTLMGIVGAKGSKGNLKQSAAELGKDLVIGVIGGGLTGALVGRPSLLVGIALTGAGHYMGNQKVAVFGVGMMASGGFQTMTGTMSGTNGLEGVKERLNAFKKNMKHQLYLDKIIKSKKGTDENAEATSGFGNVQYFVYPGENQFSGNELDMRSLEQIERQVAESASAFESTQGISGADDISDRNL